MKKTKFLIAFLVLISISLAITPPVLPQIGTYTFHGAAGNQKVLKVRTVNSTALVNLFGPTWNDILEDFFGPGCITVGAQFKSVVVSVNTSGKIDTDALLLGLGTLDVTYYSTKNWWWTTTSFGSEPDLNQTVFSFYDPNDLTDFVRAYYSVYWILSVNVSVNNAGGNMAQLPTSVPQYLGAIVWEDKWENMGNTVVHHAEAGDPLTNYATVHFYSFLDNCTEIWTYDETYGAWIGYKILDETDTVIYEFNIETPLPGIPGYEFSIILGVSLVSIIGLIFVIMRKKR